MYHHSFGRSSSNMCFNIDLYQYMSMIETSMKLMVQVGRVYANSIAAESREAANLVFGRENLCTTLFYSFLYFVGSIENDFPDLRITES